MQYQMNEFLFKQSFSEMIAYTSDIQDGEYLYTCLNDGASSGAVTTIVKTELVTGKVVAKYEGIMIDHANDLTYNPKTKE